MSTTIIVRGTPALQPDVISIKSDDLGTGAVIFAVLLASRNPRKDGVRQLLLVTDEDSVVPLTDDQNSHGVVFSGKNGWYLQGVVRVPSLTLTLPGAEDEEPLF